MSHSYRLHKLILSRCKYFENFFEDLWKNNHELDQEPEAVSVLELGFSHDDKITPDSFDITLKALYGDEQYKTITSTDELISIFALSHYLDFPELIEFSLAKLSNSVDQYNAGSISRFLYERDYGDKSAEILYVCKRYLCTEL